MTAEAAPDRQWFDITHSSASLNKTVAAWMRPFFSNPGPVASAIELIGALAVVSVLPLRHWPGPAFIVLVIALVAALSNAGVRLVVGKRLPPWSLQVDVLLGNVFVSIITGAGASGHVNLANLYLLVEVFAVLYLPLRSALYHLAGAGVAYALVLAVGPKTVEPPVIAWLSVFGTGAVLAVVVAGLMSVLRSTAREDSLTGLANRRAWDERLEVELERAARYGTPLSVVVLDIDGFKSVNDSNGHLAGDRLLQSAARSWESMTRGGGDLVARIGGDEFGLLAPGSDELGAHALARRLVQALPEGVSASVGVATWDHVEGAANLLRRADQMMYQAKRRRRLGDDPHAA